VSVRLNVAVEFSGPIMMAACASHSKVQARLSYGGTRSDYGLGETFNNESVSHFGTDGTNQ
jgi:hypothetical protein